MRKILSYVDKLKKPKWQKMRLLILEKNNFTCEFCGSSENTLHIHHTYYEKGLEPWDYPEESLKCLCEDCHKYVQDNKILLDRQIGRVSVNYSHELIGYAIGCEACDNPENVFHVLSAGVAEGIADRWRLKTSDIIEALVEGCIDGIKLEEISLKSKRR